jgi:exodeoxyribonuclease VIII
MKVENVAGPLDIPNDEYHASGRVSSSLIKRFASGTPAHAMVKMKQSDAMKIGSAIHTLALEPELFNAEYMVLPDDFDGRTKAGKELVASIAALGKYALKHDDYNSIFRVSESIKKTKIMCETWHIGLNEKSFHAEIEGVPVQIRPDRFVYPCDEYPNGLIIDVKSTVDASPIGFGKQVAQLSMHIQAAFYQLVMSAHFAEKFPFSDLDLPDFVWVAAEKTEPFAVGVYAIGFEASQIGLNDAKAAFATLKRCLDSGEFPAYSGDVQTIILPSWMYSEEL